MKDSVIVPFFVFELSVVPHPGIITVSEIIKVEIAAIIVIIVKGRIKATCKNEDRPARGFGRRGAVGCCKTPG